MKRHKGKAIPCLIVWYLQKCCFAVGTVGLSPSTKKKNKHACVNYNSSLRHHQSGEEIKKFVDVLLLPIMQYALLSIRISYEKKM